jgi:hypothetical protein
MIIKLDFTEVRGKDVDINNFIKLQDGRMDELVLADIMKELENVDGEEVNMKVD